jgi:hypothetical protein
MNIAVSRVEVNEIMPLRELYQQEMNCQITHDSFPRRGFSDAYLLQVGGRIAGYGTVANRHDPDTVDEFYLLPDYRAAAHSAFRQFVEVSQATKIRAQTNDRLMLLMLYDYGTNITSDTILFSDAFTTHLTCPNSVLRKRGSSSTGEGDWILESDGVPVATGGALFHYNPPYGDLYMEVREGYRQRGFGSYLVQELKRICYEMGKIPAARCGVSNIASRRTMEKAGLLPCGRILVGEVATE